MGVEFKGFNELVRETTELAARIDNGAVTDAALEAGAKPIYDRMKQTVPKHNYKKSNKMVTGGTLSRSLKIKPPASSGAGRKITIGVHYKDSPVDRTGGTGAYYVNPVEFGHGGPFPAPAHAFIAPAYDVEAENAYNEMLRVMRDALNL